MKVWKVSHPGVIVLEDLGASKLKKDCVKLKMLTSALTSTEKLAFRGELDGCELPIVLGRQGVGMVSEVDSSVTSLKRGDRVYVSSQVACNDCYFCRSGRRQECNHLLTYGKDVDGVLSDFAVVSTDNLYVLPDRVADEDAVLVETIALAVHTINTLEVGRGDHLVILGASVFGLVLAQVALYYQAVPILVDKRVSRLNLAEQLDVYYCINSAREDVSKRVFAITGGKMAKRVVYSLDASTACPSATVFDLVASHGKVGFVGSDSDVGKLDVNVKPAVDKNVTFYGISLSTENITTAINMLANGTINVKPLMEVIDFNDTKEYLEKFVGGGEFLQLVVRCGKIN